MSPKLERRAFSSPTGPVLFTSPAARVRKATAPRDRSRFSGVAPPSLAIRGLFRPRGLCAERAGSGSSEPGGRNRGGSCPQVGKQPGPRCAVAAGEGAARGVPRIVDGPLLSGDLLLVPCYGFVEENSQFGLFLCVNNLLGCSKPWRKSRRVADGAADLLQHPLYESRGARKHRLRLNLPQ